MAVSYIDFEPSTTSPFQFSATLDGSGYNIVVTYNIFGQRYYLNIYTAGGSLVASVPMVSSPPNYGISLTAGYFTSTIVYRAENSQFEISDTPIAYPDFAVRPDYLLGYYGEVFVLDSSLLS